LNFSLTSLSARSSGKGRCARFCLAFWSPFTSSQRWEVS
jgi:hypothetical protein